MNSEITIMYYFLNYCMTDKKSLYDNILNDLKNIDIGNFLNFTQDLFEDSFSSIKKNIRNYDELFNLSKKYIIEYKPDIEPESFKNYLIAKYLGRCYMHKKDLEIGSKYMTEDLKNLLSERKKKSMKENLCYKYSHIFYRDGNEIRIYSDNLKLLKKMNDIKISLNFEPIVKENNDGNIILNKIAFNEIEENLSLLKDYSADEIILTAIKNIENILNLK